MIIDMQDYEKQKEYMQLFSKIVEGEASAKSPDDLISHEEVMKKLGILP